MSQFRTIEGTRDKTNKKNPTDITPLFITLMLNEWKKCFIALSIQSRLHLHVFSDAVCWCINGENWSDPISAGLATSNWPHGSRELVVMLTSCDSVVCVCVCVYSNLVCP